jgi:hypothetical protein
MLPAVMVVAFRVRVVLKPSFQESIHASVAASLGPRQDLDAAALDHLSGAGAYPAADERVDPVVQEYLDQASVGEASVAHYARRYDLSVLHVVYLEIFRSSEVLEHLSVIVAYRNLHGIGRKSSRFD